MTMDRTTRLSEIGAVLAERAPSVLDAVTALLESIPPAAHPERYEITRKIGDGGQAEVLLGTAQGEEGFHRLVAIKRVRPDVPNAVKVAVDLINEAHLAAPLSHPNVVSVLDVGRSKAGQPFLVMEHVDGVDLRKLIETGPLPHPVAIFVGRELLSGLGYIHQSRNLGRGRVRPGLVHRDVSPANVLLSWEGEVKLADFGVAQMMDRTMTTAAYVAVGKPGYMSPEQVNRQMLDGRSDLYAVGIVLWELLAHRRLRVGAKGDREAKAVFQAIPRPSRYRQGVPADLEDVAMRLLAYERAERYRTAEFAAHDLMRCQDVSRDGRGDLVRLLDERFPRSRRRRPTSRPPAPGTPSEVRTLTAPSESVGAPPWPPWPMELRRLEALPYLVTARASAEAIGSAPSASLRPLFAQGTRNLPISPPFQETEIPVDRGARARVGLRSFLERLLGWKDVLTVDRAMRSIARTVGKRAPLVLCGDGDLVPIAHALHWRAFGPDRPFVLADPRRRKDMQASLRHPASYVTGMATLDDAPGGAICVISRRPPRDFAQAVKALRDPATRAWLVVCADRQERCAVLLAVSEPIQVPPLADRASELPRIVEEYGEDARIALSTTAPFTEEDRDWVIAGCASSLHEIELATLRRVALRHAGDVSRAAELLGMTRGALGEWLSKRRTKRTKRT